MEDVTGEFTNNISRKILVFIDECNIKTTSEAGIIKNIITGEEIRDRAMYSDPVYRENYTNIATSSNNRSFMVGMEKNRRSYFLTSELEPLLRHPIYSQFQPAADANSTILPPPDAEAYFISLRSSMMANNYEGLKTLANFLYNLPLGYYDPRKQPPSFSKQQQQLLSMSNMQQWWYEILCRGYVEEVRRIDSRGNETVMSEWPEAMEMNKLWHDYQRRLEHNKTSAATDDPNSEMQFEQALVKLTGMRIVSETSNYGGAVRKSMFPLLEEAQANWTKSFPTLPLCNDTNNIPSITDIFKRRVESTSVTEMFDPIPPFLYSLPVCLPERRHNKEELIAAAREREKTQKSLLEVERENGRVLELRVWETAVSRHQQRKKETEEQRVYRLLFGPNAAPNYWQAITPESAVQVLTYMLSNPNGRFMDRNYRGPNGRLQKRLNEYSKYNQAFSSSRKMHAGTCIILRHLKEWISKEPNCIALIKLTK